ncbi:MAG: alpha/beta hydrolase [Terriglobales bacterium]
MSNYFAFKSIRVVALGSALLFLAGFSPAQVSSGPRPLADPADHRFDGVHQDWTTPALAGSNLRPARPLEFINDYPHYTMELLRVQWRWGDPIDLYVIKPKGVKKPPVILYLYGYPTDTDFFKREDYQELVTKDGFAAVGFVSALTGHRYHDRPMKEWFISELQECLASSAHDVQMVLNYLDSRGDLDMNRVGMFTEGSGASIAILASGVDPRIKVVEALDPWGDWPTWMATSPFVPENERADYVKPEFLKKVAALEPVDWLPKMQVKKFRLDDELFDTKTPKPAKEQLRAACPPGTNVMLYKNMEEFKAAFQNGKNLEWIQHELQSLAEPGASASKGLSDPGRIDTSVK